MHAEPSPLSSTPLSFGLAIVLAASGCHRDEKPRPQPKPHPVASVRSAPGTKTAPSGSEKPPPPTPEAEAAEKTVRAWSDALDGHDLEKLGGLYADTVRFYGRDLSKNAVIAAKRAAFAKQPGFRQELIGEISLSLYLGVFTASFTKKAGPADDFLVNGAKLGIKESAGKFVIVEETDEESARKELRAREACEAKVTEVVLALPEVKFAVKVALEEISQSDGGWSMGGIGPNDDGEGGFSAEVGVRTEVNIDTRYSYSVDRKGQLSVTTRGGRVDVPREALQSVANACRH